MDHGLECCMRPVLLYCGCESWTMRCENRIGGSEGAPYGMNVENTVGREASKHRDIDRCGCDKVACREGGERWPRAFTRFLYGSWHPIRTLVLIDSYGWSGGALREASNEEVSHELVTSIHKSLRVTGVTRSPLNTVRRSISTLNLINRSVGIKKSPLCWKILRKTVRRRQGKKYSAN